MIMQLIVKLPVKIGLIPLALQHRPASKFLENVF